MPPEYYGSDIVFVELLRLRIGDIKSQLGNAQLFLSEDVRKNILVYWQRKNHDPAPLIAITERTKLGSNYD